MHSHREVRKAVETAAALVLIDQHAGNPTLIQRLGEFILAANRYLSSPTNRNETEMVGLATRPEIQAINHSQPLL